MAVKERRAYVGSPRTVVIGNYAGALSRVLSCGEEGAQMCFCEASQCTHLEFHRNINGESFSQLDGVLCFRPLMLEESSSKDYCYSTPTLTCQSKSIGNDLGYSSSVENDEYWLVQMGNLWVEVGVKENMLDFYALMLTKTLGSEKSGPVCICHFPWGDFGFCSQIDEQCVIEQVGSVNETLTGSKGCAFIGYTTEEVSASALKAIVSKSINVTAQTEHQKYSAALLRALSHEPPDVG